MGSNPGPLSLSEPSQPSVRWAHPRAFAGCAGEEERNGICTDVRMPLAFSQLSFPAPGPALSLALCTLPHLPLSLPNLALPVAQTCGQRRREFHWGSLLNSHHPASARIFSLSLNLSGFVIPLLSPSICAGGLGRRPAPSRGHQHCPAAWQGIWASPHPLCASVSSPLRRGR